MLLRSRGASNSGTPLTPSQIRVHRCPSVVNWFSGWLRSVVLIPRPEHKTGTINAVKAPSPDRRAARAHRRRQRQKPINRLNQDFMSNALVGWLPEPVVLNQTGPAQNGRTRSQSSYKQTAPKRSEGGSTIHKSFLRLRKLWPRMNANNTKGNFISALSAFFCGYRSLVAALLLWVVCGSRFVCIRSIRGFLPSLGVFAPLLLFQPAATERLSPRFSFSAVFASLHRAVYFVALIAL